MLYSSPRYPGALCFNFKGKMLPLAYMYSQTTPKTHTADSKSPLGYMQQIIQRPVELLPCDDLTEGLRLAMNGGFIVSL